MRSRRRLRFRWTARCRRRAAAVIEFLVLCAAIVTALLMATGRFTFPTDAFTQLAAKAGER